MPELLVVGGIGLLVLFFTTKIFVWDKPKEEMRKLRRDIATLQKLHQVEISKLTARLQDSKALHIQEFEFSDIIAYSALKEIVELGDKEYGYSGGMKAPDSSFHNSSTPVKYFKRRFEEAVVEQYKYRYLTYLHPEVAGVFSGTEIVKTTREQLPRAAERTENLFEVVNLLRSKSKVSDELIYFKNKVSFMDAAKSNLTAIPYMAKIMADYETFGLERLAKELDWGHSIKRMDKIKTIRAIREDARAIVEKNKESQYQLAYLLRLFPNLEDVVDAEFNQLPSIEVSELSEYDSVRNYLSKEEYAALSVSERNQLALDKYRESHKRTKWQIGRDYELYVGYKYTQQGCDIDYFGSYMGLEDLGRDIIAQKNDNTRIIQCKYWSSRKMIHEKHVNQLYGTMISYCIERNVDKSHVKGLLVTNIELSPMAKKMASYLGIEYVEGFEVGDYPCIKCNIGRDELGMPTKIYHLPFDQQYDSAKIKNAGECYAMTVAEAEEKGFRRAYKWFGND